MPDAVRTRARSAVLQLAFNASIRERVHAFLGGRALFTLTLRERAAALLRESWGLKSAAMDSRVEWLPHDGEWLDDEQHTWLEAHLAHFEARRAPTVEQARHLLLVLATYNAGGMDTNAIRFPRPVLSEKKARLHERLSFQSSVLLSCDVEARRVEARGRRHKEVELSLWGTFLEKPLWLPGRDGAFSGSGGADIGAIAASTAEGQAAEDYTHQLRLAALAVRPDQLREELYGDDAGDTRFDTALLSESAAWDLAPVGIIAEDATTKEQDELRHRREELGLEYWSFDSVTARAQKRLVLPSFLAALLAPEAEPRDLEAARAWRAERSANERSQAVQEFESRAAEGARLTCWPSGGRWPPPEWGKRAASIEASWKQKAAGASSIELSRASKVASQSLRSDRRAPLMYKRSPPRQQTASLQLAVQRGDAVEVRRGLKVGEPARFELLQDACALIRQDRPRCKFASADAGGPEGGAELAVNFMTGASVRLHVDPSSTVQQVRDRVSAAAGLDQSAGRFLQLLTMAGGGLYDLGAEIATACNSEPPWILSAIFVDRGSMLAVKITEQLLQDGHCALGSKELSGEKGLKLVRAAAKAGNSALVEMLIETGVVLKSAMAEACDLWSKGFEVIAVLRALLSCGAEPPSQLLASAAAAAGLSRRIDAPIQDLARHRDLALIDTLLGPWTRMEYVKKALLEIGSCLWPLVSLRHPHLCRDAALFKKLMSSGDAQEHFVWASPEILSSREFMLEAVGTNWLGITFVSSKLREDAEVALRAVEQDIAAADYFPDGVWSAEFTRQVFETNRRLIAYAPAECVNDVAYVDALVAELREGEATFRSFEKERGDGALESGAASKAVWGVLDRMVQLAELLEWRPLFARERAAARQAQRARWQKRREVEVKRLEDLEVDIRGLAKAMDEVGPEAASRRMATALLEVEDVLTPANVHRFRSASAYSGFTVWGTRTFVVRLLRVVRWLLQGRITRTQGDDDACNLEWQAICQLMCDETHFLVQLRSLDVTNLPEIVARAAAVELSEVGSEERFRRQVRAWGINCTFLLGLLTWANGALAARRLAVMDTSAGSALEQAYRAARDRAEQRLAEIDAKLGAEAAEGGGVQSAAGGGERRGRLGMEAKEAEVLAKSMSSATSALTRELQCLQEAQPPVLQDIAEKTNTYECLLQELRAVKDDLERKLDVVLPQVQAADDIFNRIDKRDLGEIRCFCKPPELLRDTCRAMLVMLKAVGVSKHGSTGDGSTGDWRDCLRMTSDHHFLHDMKGCLDRILQVDMEEKAISEARAIMANVDRAKAPKVSRIADIFCRWLDIVFGIYDMIVSLVPERQHLREMEGKFAAALTELDVAKALAKQQEDDMAMLQDLLERATAQRDLTQSSLDSSGSPSASDDMLASPQPACGAPALWLRE